MRMNSYRSSSTRNHWVASAIFFVAVPGQLRSQEAASPAIAPKSAIAANDRIAQMQQAAISEKTAPWGHWGNRPRSYSAWTNHSNRLIPVYVFGGSFGEYMNQGSVYRDAAKLEALYGQMPTNTLREDAPYADQTDIYRLQRKAIDQLGKKYVFLVVFDGMDWQSTQAAAIYKSGRVYTEGKGSGLVFQDYAGCQADYGFVVTAPYGDEVETDVDAQQNTKPVSKFGGFDSRYAGSFPWETERDIDYPIGRSKVSPHAYTDSSSSATSMTAGIKAINGAVNLDYKLEPVETIAQWAQRTKGFSVGAVTSVPISHATPAAAYSANVSRDDYQDLTRDMLGLPSVARKTNPLPGLDVVLGCGFGENTEKPTGQGQNFIPGNRYLADEDRAKVDVKTGGPYAKYVVAQRTSNQNGAQVLMDAAKQAAANRQRLLGFFGVKNGHLPFQTANGDFKPVADMKEDIESYSPADISENPSLAQMAEAAIEVLQTNDKGFWLMVEAGDVDWANHSNNIDSSIGAVLSGDAAIQSIFSWIEKRNAWDQSLVVVTADHGHFFHLVQPEAINGN
jgi:alkaline phosphatase